MATVTRRAFWCVLALGSSLVAASAAAEPPFRPEPAPSYSLSLEDADAAPLPSFRHHGVTFVLGTPGEHYQIRVTNPYGERVEAVVSVDGRDAVSGRRGDYVSQRGYVLGPYESVLIEGFRQSLERVASFRFVDPEDSYSARLGTPQNVGIVGVAFFRERRHLRSPVPIARPRLEDSKPRPSSARASAAKGANESDSRLGTEYGESIVSRVNETRFERRSSRPERVVTLRYDDADGLIARGIDLSGVRPYSRHVEPEAFPDSRFAAPPPAR